MLGAVLMLLFTAALAWLYSWTVRNAAAAAPHHPDELPPQEAAIR
jgi:ABC-type Fe3+ transport system permease subunit